MDGLAIDGSGPLMVITLINTTGKVPAPSRSISQDGEADTAPTPHGSNLSDRAATSGVLSPGGRLSSMRSSFFGERSITVKFVRRDPGGWSVSHRALLSFQSAKVMSRFLGCWPFLLMTAPVVQASVTDAEQLSKMDAPRGAQTSAGLWWRQCGRRGGSLARRDLAGIGASKLPRHDRREREALLDAAIARLRRILIFHPDLPRPRLELARAFFLKGRTNWPGSISSACWPASHPQP